MPSVCESGGVASGEREVGVRGLWASGIGDGGDDLSSHPDPAAAVVRGRVADDPLRSTGCRRSPCSARLGWSYQTAWAMLHRYRVAMVRPGRERLAGHVEVDEAYVGGVEGNAQGRRTATKAIVAIAVEIENPKGFGRIRLKHVPDVSAESLLPFIDEAIESGASVHTDGWQAYWTLPDRGYEHERTVMRQQRRARACGDAWCAPRSESAAALAAGHPPGACQPRAPRRVPQRIHLPIQSTPLATSPAFSSTGCWKQSIAAHPVTYRSLVVNPTPTGRRSAVPPRPGRVAIVPAVHRPWRENAAAMGLPDSNG